MFRIKSLLCALLVAFFTITFTVNVYAHTVQERVVAGASFLDKNMPGWDKEINLADLNMADTRKCILGQLFYNYSVGKDRLNITFAESKDLGFDSIVNTNSAYRRIEAAWIEHIKIRRAIGN